MRDAWNEMSAGGTAVVLAIVMTGAWSLGWWQGRRMRKAGIQPTSGKFEDAIMAVLGLLLAFTFSMALGKYEQRRLMLIADSNSIGDFYTCATLLPEPAKTKLQAVIRKYVELRLSLAERPSVAALDESLSRFARMQGEMSALVAAAIDAGTPIAVPLTNTLNALTSAQASRLAAIRDRLPASIVALLFLAAAVSTALAGLSQGAAANPQVAGSIGFIVLVALVLYVTLDLNTPGSGLITVSQEPMRRLLLSMTP
jgi:uncharacterized membrane protein